MIRKTCQSGSLSRHALQSSCTFAKNKRNTNLKTNPILAAVTIDCKCLHEIMCWNPTLLQCRTRSCIVSQFACRRSSRDRLRFNTLCCVISKCEVCEIVCVCFFSKRDSVNNRFVILPLDLGKNANRDQCKDSSSNTTMDLSGYFVLQFAVAILIILKPLPFSKTRQDLD